MSSKPTSVPQGTEEALAFQAEGQTLVGILHEAPPSNRSSTGVLIIVGGPQYRVGSHRQFLRLARDLAARGHSTLRFDVRGMGDSSGPLHTFEDISPDIEAALDTLYQNCPHVDQTVLFGLCDGASAALLYLARRPDRRVGGLCLLNPWVRSEVSLARTHVKHYYLQRLAQPEFWRKLVSGQVAGQAVRELISNLRKAGSAQPTKASAASTASYQDRMASAWRAFCGPMLLILSGNDYTAREFEQYIASDPAWQGTMEQPGLQTLHMPGADHTFSHGADAAKLQSSVGDWIDRQVSGLGAATRADHVRGSGQHAHL